MNSNFFGEFAGLDEIPEEAFPIQDPIGVTFAGGVHESDLLSFLERTQRLAGEVCWAAFMDRTEPLAARNIYSVSPDERPILAVTVSEMVIFVDGEDIDPIALVAAGCPAGRRSRPRRGAVLARRQHLAGQPVRRSYARGPSSCV